MRLLVIGDGRSLGDVNAVQELTDILLLAQADAVDEGASAADGLDVGAFDDELVLGGVGLLDLGVTDGVDDADDFLAEVVADLDALTAINDVGVDGEMAVNQAHLEAELLSDANDHVVDVGGEGAEGGQVLGEAVPHVHGHLLLVLAQAGILNFAKI